MTTLSHAVRVALREGSIPEGPSKAALQAALEHYDLHDVSPVTQRKLVLRWLLDQHPDCWHTVTELWDALKAHKDTSMHTRLWLGLPTWTISRGSFASVLSTMGADGTLEREGTPYRYRAAIMPGWSPPAPAPRRYGMWHSQ